MYTYSPFQWLLIFYVYCFFGWCLETAYVSLLQRRFVNRGFVRGPMLPLYGTGAVMILFVALPLKNQPVELFFAGMLAATVLEYVTGWAMETLFKVKYWDYSEHKCQYKGRICLQSSVAWGALSLLLVWVIQPPIARLVLAVPPLIALIAGVTISVFFALDLGYAFRTALDLAQVLDELTRLREQMNEKRAELAETVSEAREKITDTVQDTYEQLAGVAADAREQLANVAADTREKREENRQERREKLEKTLSELSCAYEKRVAALGRARRSLLRANPSAVSEKFGEALSELKQRFHAKR